MSAEIYSTPTCGNCVSAKTLLKSKNIPYVEYTIGADVDKSTLEARIGTPIRSVPQIFINDEYVGGLQELRFKIS
ncbi:glutaredoxin [Xanthomonas phage Xoo-sp13]|nr:glutaredoxin [Xanthomonas phage Xoo-sp13]